MQLIEGGTRDRPAVGAPTGGDTPAPVLELAGVTKRYGSAAAVRDVDLRVHAGEFVVLLGPSGSGKTTLLNLVAGFTDTDEGVIRLGGRRITELPPHRRDIGVVFQSYALFPHLNVGRNVAFPLAMRRLRKREIEERVDEALSLVGLEEYRQRMPRELSGGQQQRVALARALVFKPRLLLMDEPMAALDRRLREHLQQELKQMHRSLGLTVCYVTHDQGEAFVLADRIGVMHEGQLVQVGPPVELYERPASSFVARFVGDTNLLNGTVAGSGDDATFTSGGLSVAASATGGTVPVSSGECEAMLTVRPHRVLVDTAGRPLGPPDTHLSVSGTVVACDYLGAEVRLVVHADSVGVDLLCRGDVRRNGALEAGDAVEIGWRHSDAVLLFE